MERLHNLFTGLVVLFLSFVGVSSNNIGATDKTIVTSTSSAIISASSTNTIKVVKSGAVGGCYFIEGDSVYCYLSEILYS